MDLKIWSKTLLNSYMCFEKIADAIDKLVLTYGLDSYHLHDIQAFEFSAEQMIELTERKKLLINLKVMCDETLSKMTPKYARILILKYIDGIKSSDIAKLLGVSLRSYFRWMSEAINSFSLKLKNLGYTDEILKEMCENEIWIKQLYNKYFIAELSIKPKKDIVEELDDILSLAITSFKQAKQVNYSSI